MFFQNSYNKPAFSYFFPTFHNDMLYKIPKQNCILYEIKMIL